MRVSVKTVSAIDPATIDRMGAAYTNAPLSFIQWMRSYCPSSAVAVRQHRPNQAVWTDYMGFSLPDDTERDVFIARWGDHHEKPYSIIIGE